MKNEIIQNFIKNWISSVDKKDHSEIEKLFSDKVTFISPIVYSQYKDKMIIFKILKWIIEIIQEFKYLETYYNNENLTVTLFFDGKIKEKKSGKFINIQGVDLIKLDENGKITELRVMLRPLNATMELASEMKNRMLSLKSKI
jgi:hypothetical protein